MTTDIVKYEVESRVRVELLKHRGDVVAVSRVTGYPLPYIEKIFHKQRKQRKLDVSRWVADSIMETILVGYEQRIAYLQRCLEVLEGKEEAYISICHGEPVEQVQPRRTPYWRCLKCNNRTGVELKTRGGVVNLILSTIAALKAEDESLVVFAEKMGYTNREAPTINDNRQNLFIFTNGKAAIDATLAKQIEDMSPLERERTRKQLSSKLLEMASVESKEVKK